jgi:hypothetical protein
MTGMANWTSFGSCIVGGCLGKTHALIKYSVFAVFDGFLFLLFIQEQHFGFI